ncbi:MAG: transposase family protein [Planctomycetes bacterium]|nr:transposase family protein [Planctomycetota bacterium]
MRYWFSPALGDREFSFAPRLQERGEDQREEEQSTAPLVLQTDNGSAYVSELVAAWCARHGVLQLLSLPHTPQHNGAAEHGMRELKEESLLGKGVRVLDIEAARARLLAARDKLDGHRLRRTRGWKTAVEADRDHPPWSTLITRLDFLQNVACRMPRALLDSLGGRARRRAVRAAILDALEDLSVIKRTRGDQSGGVR